MRLIPDSNGEDAQPEPLREDNYCQLPNGRLAPKGQGSCQGGPAPTAARTSPVPEVNPRSPLRRGTPTDIQELGGGINPSFTLEMVTEDGQRMRGVYKPIDGERFPYGSVHNEDMRLAERDVAVWEVDQMLGIGLTPETTMVTTDEYGPGSLMRFAEGAVNGFEWQDGGGEKLRADDGLRFAVLDMVIGNLDRHPGNYMMYEDGTPVAIDHGYTFPAAEGKDGIGHCGSQPVLEWATGRLPGMASVGLGQRLLARLRSADWDAFMAAHDFSESEKIGLNYRLDFVIKHLSQGTEAFRLAIADHYGWRQGSSSW